MKIWYIQLYCPYIVQNFWSDLDNAQKPKNSKHNVESSSFLSKVFRSWIVSTILQPMTKSWCQNSWIPTIRIRINSSHFAWCQANLKISLTSWLNKYIGVILSIASENVWIYANETSTGQSSHKTYFLKQLHSPVNITPMAWCQVRSDHRNRWVCPIYILVSLVMLDNYLLLEERVLRI